VKAFVKANASSSDLKDEIRFAVRSSLAEYAYPREIEFVDNIPISDTGKIEKEKLKQNGS